jgi:hypothetical protein
VHRAAAQPIPVTIKANTEQRTRTDVNYVKGTRPPPFVPGGRTDGDDLHEASRHGAPRPPARRAGVFRPEAGSRRDASHNTATRVGGGTTTPDSIDRNSNKYQARDGATTRAGDDSGAATRSSRLAPRAGRGAGRDEGTVARGAGRTANSNSRNANATATKEGRFGRFFLNPQKRLTSFHGDMGGDMGDDAAGLVALFDVTRFCETPSSQL